MAWLQVLSRQERLEEGVRRQMGVPVERWGVREVCAWAECIGLGQYRKRFLHHCIGGSLLLGLTEHNLKVLASYLCTHTCLVSAPGGLPFISASTVPIARSIQVQK